MALRCLLVTLIFEHECRARPAGFAALLSAMLLFVLEGMFFSLLAFFFLAFRRRWILRSLARNMVALILFLVYHIKIKGRRTHPKNMLPSYWVANPMHAARFVTRTVCVTCAFPSTNKGTTRPKHTILAILANSNDFVEHARKKK